MIYSYENYCNRIKNGGRIYTLEEFENFTNSCGISSDGKYTIPKKFILKKITKKYINFTEVRYLKMVNVPYKRKSFTIYDHRRVAYKVDIETGETRHKTRLEVENNIKTSRSRTLKKLKDYLQANDWKFFLTLTFNDVMQDRLNDNETIDRFRKYIDNMKHQFPDMYYVAVAENHKKGGLHFHLIVGGVTAAQLKLKYWKSKKRKGGNGYQRIYNVMTFQKYGFTTATYIDNTNACGNYILKYVSKAMGEVEILKNRYIASKNLLLPETSVINNFYNDEFILKNNITDFVFDSLPVNTKIMYMTDKFICLKIFQSDNLNNALQGEK